MYTLSDIILIGLFSLQVLYVSIFFSYTLKHRYSRRLAIFVGWAILMTGIIITYQSYTNILLRQFFFLTDAMIICRVIYKSSWKEDLFSIAMIWSIGFICDTAAASFIFVCFPKASDYLSGFYLILANVFYEIIYIPVMHIILFFWKKRRRWILNKSIYATFLFPVSQMLMMEILVYYITLQIATTRRYYPEAIAIAMTGIILYIFADIFLFQVILDDSQKERLAVQLEMMNLQACRELEYYQYINEKIRESRKLRHDFGNQLQTVYCIIQNDTAPEQEFAVRVSKALEESGEQNFSAEFCENIIVNVILEEKARIAARQGISLHVSVALPEEIFVEKVDLCSVFSNLLDNAIHAAAKVSEDRYIQVTASVSGCCCKFITVNSCSRDTEKISCAAFDADKTDIHGGYGLCILRSIGEKYKGELVTQKENGRFTARLTLNQTEMQ